MAEVVTTARALSEQRRISKTATINWVALLEAQTAYDLAVKNYTDPYGK
jgi:hypothetical protein